MRVKDPEFLAAADWRGAPCAVEEIPRLSPFVERVLQRSVGADAAARARLLERWSTTAWDRAAMEAELGGAADGADAPVRFASAIRQLRQRVVASLIVRDASGACGLDEVVATTTALAELAIERAVAVHARELAAHHGVPSSDGVAQDLLVVGMGKLGGAELNVSSDIDLVFVYDEEGETQAAGEATARPLTNHEFFVRLGRRVIPALSDVTGDGFVFRVDMRLRPNGDSGPLAVSTAMLEEYLVAQGREWERFAWLKGRVVSAPVFASADAFERQCAALGQIVQPFVYRKYLDFGAINALRDLHVRIRAESSRRSAGRASMADNIKLGRGGIREIEFIAQTFQIIRGGRDPAFRSHSTLAMLQTLGDRAVLPTATCARLAAAYVFLRNLEHALQYVDDAQTHQIPAEDDARQRVARLLGARDAAAMVDELRTVQDFVAAAFDSVFAEPEEAIRSAPMPAGWNAPGEPDERPLLEHLQEQGFQDPAGTAERLKNVLASRRLQAASEAARSGIERLLQRALAAAITLGHGLGAAHDIGPDEHFARFARLAEVIAGRNTYVTLLNQFPHAFERVMRILAASRWAADYLALHPILLDELLDERLHEREPDWSAWTAGVRRQLDETTADHERQMNLLRDVHHAQVFRLLVADLDDRLTVERLADHLSALADHTLGLTLECVWQTVAKRHRELPRFVVIGYGKLGGKELGYVSDLDLIFLFDDEHPDAAEIYALLARRLVTWLTTQTSSGNLFDIDLRLRPNGNAGLMVSSFDAFARYQRNEDGLGAWVWEHQALTRARWCAGDAEIGFRFEAERVKVLTQVRDLEKLKSEVLAMRRKMHEGHPNPSALFDLKHDRGGMVDIEFIVQYLVLAFAHRHGDLVRNWGNIALLQAAGGLRLIDATLARDVADAYRRFRALQHRLRLNGAERARVDPAEVEREAAAVRRLWRAVFQTD
jgi:glutamate-ammonia-ligase adenylyltransferase